MGSRGEPAHPSVADLVGYLSDGVSVHLVGLPGSGRSVLARGVLERLPDAGCEAIWVKAVAPLRDRPLAALALAGVPIEPVPASVSTTMVVAKATDALGRMVGMKRAALVIDDAEHLDNASGGVILAAHARKPFPMLFVDRPGRDADELVSALIAESQPGVRLTVGPLPLDDIHHLIHDSLQGVVEPAVVAKVAMLSGGLPLLITAIVDAARRSGRLTRCGGVWSLTGELWDERLAQVLHPLILGLPGEDVAALTAVARADDPAAVEAVLSVRPAAVMRLREAGLLRQAGRLSGRSATVFPPLLAGYLRRHGPLDPAFPPPARFEEAPPGWRERLPRGADASEWASRLDSHVRAEVAVLRRAWEEQPDDARAARLLAAMHTAVASPADVAEVLERVSLEGGDAEAAAAIVGWSAAYRAIARRDLDGAIAELDEWRALVPVCDGYLTAVKTHLCFLTGHASDTRPLFARARPRLRSSREAMTAVRAEYLIAAAATTQALGLLAGNEASDAMFAGDLHVCRGLARVLGDDVRGGVEWALDHLGHAVESFDPGRIDGHAYTAALGLTLLGALDDLDDLVDVVFRLPGTTTLQRHYRAGLCSLAAMAREWQGRSEQAERLTAQAIALGGGVGPFPGMLVARGDPDPLQEVRDLWERVEAGLSNGYLVAAVFGAVAAAERSVDERRAAAVVAAGAGSESAVVRALTGYVAALAAGDLAALVRSADELRSACGPVYAMRALISRAELLRTRGDSCAAAAQADAAWHESGDFGRRCPGLFARLNAAIRLSAREREIISLVARGLTSIQIADEVEVTRRTAETHTSSAYNKIGVHNRKDLCDALGTWLVV